MDFSREIPGHRKCAKLLKLEVSIFVEMGSQFLGVLGELYKTQTLVLRIWKSPCHIPPLSSAASTKSRTSSIYFIRYCRNYLVRSITCNIPRNIAYFVFGDILSRL